MTIHLVLTPEEEAALRARARTRGKEPQALVEDLVRSDLRSSETGWPPPLPKVVDENGVFHHDRWDALIAHIEENFKGAPSLPDEALTREAMYSDHD